MESLSSTFENMAFDDAKMKKVALRTPPRKNPFPKPPQKNPARPFLEDLPGPASARLRVDFLRPTAFPLDESFGSGLFLPEEELTHQSAASLVRSFVMRQKLHKKAAVKNLYSSEEDLNEEIAHRWAEESFHRPGCKFQRLPADQSRVDFPEEALSEPPAPDPEELDPLDQYEPLEEDTVGLEDVLAGFYGEAQEQEYYKKRDEVDLELARLKVKAIAELAPDPDKPGAADRRPPPKKVFQDADQTLNTIQYSLFPSIEEGTTVLEETSHAGREEKAAKIRDRQDRLIRKRTEDNREDLKNFGILQQDSAPLNFHRFQSLRADQTFASNPRLMPHEEPSKILDPTTDPFQVKEKLDNLKTLHRHGFRAGDDLDSSKAVTAKVFKEDQTFGSQSGFAPREEKSDYVLKMTGQHLPDLKLEAIGEVQKLGIKTTKEERAQLGADRSLHKIVSGEAGPLPGDQTLSSVVMHQSQTLRTVPSFSAREEASVSKGHLADPFARGTAEAKSNKAVLAKYKVADRKQKKYMDNLSSIVYDGSAHFRSLEASDPREEASQAPRSPRPGNNPHSKENNRVLAKYKLLLPDESVLEDLDGPSKTVFGPSKSFGSAEGLELHEEHSVLLGPILDETRVQKRRENLEALQKYKLLKPANPNPHPQTNPKPQTQPKVQPGLSADESRTVFRASQTFRSDDQPALAEDPSRETQPHPVEAEKANHRVLHKFHLLPSHIDVSRPEPLLKPPKPSAVPAKFVPSPDIQDYSFDTDQFDSLAESRPVKEQDTRWDSDMDLKRLGFSSPSKLESFRARNAQDLRKFGFLPTPLDLQPQTQAPAKPLQPHAQPPETKVATPNPAHSPLKKQYKNYDVLENLNKSLNETLYKSSNNPKVSFSSKHAKNTASKSVDLKKPGKETDPEVGQPKRPQSKEGSVASRYNRLPSLSGSKEVTEFQPPVHKTVLLDSLDLDSVQLEQPQPREEKSFTHIRLLHDLIPHQKPAKQPPAPRTKTPVMAPAKSPAKTPVMVQVKTPVTPPVMPPAKSPAKIPPQVLGRNKDPDPLPVPAPPRKLPEPHAAQQPPPQKKPADAPQPPKGAQPSKQDTPQPPKKPADAPALPKPPQPVPAAPRPELHESLYLAVADGVEEGVTGMNNKHRQPRRKPAPDELQDELLLSAGSNEFERVRLEILRKVEDRREQEEKPHPVPIHISPEQIQSLSPRPGPREQPKEQARGRPAATDPKTMKQMLLRNIGWLEE